MVNKVIAALCALLLFTSCQQAQASQDASAAWDAVAHTYNFDTLPEAPFGATFAQGYNGSSSSSCASDLAAALTAVAEAMDTGVPDIGPDDLMNALYNWPDS